MNVETMIFYIVKEEFYIFVEELSLDKTIFVGDILSVSNRMTNEYTRVSDDFKIWIDNGYLNDFQTKLYEVNSINSKLLNLAMK